MTKAAEEALAACVAAEESVIVKEANIKKMKSADIPILDVVAKDLEDAKYNLVTAEGAVATMELKVKEATQKVAALKNGTAKVATASKPATSNRASIISKPENPKPTAEDIAEAIGGTSKTSTIRKQSRAEKKKAAALARKQAVTNATNKVSTAK